MTTVFLDDREYEHNGHKYIFRDIFIEDRKQLQCQYKTKNDDGDVIWNDCPEGSEFSDVAPFEAVT